MSDPTDVPVAGPVPDPTLSTTARLSIVAVLAAAVEVDFGTVRDTIGTTDSALSKQASALEAAGYVWVRKLYVGKRPRTRLALSPAGREAFTRHVAALNQIVARAGAEIDFPPSAVDHPG